MANVTLREYADIAVGFSKVIQAGAEPALLDQQIVTSGASAQSAAFGANTRVIAISIPGAPTTGIACLFGANPTALATSLRLPANSITFFGVKPGQRVALIDVA